MSYKEILVPCVFYISRVTSTGHVLDREVTFAFFYLDKLIVIGVSARLCCVL